MRVPRIKKTWQYCLVESDKYNFQDLRILPGKKMILFLLEYKDHFWKLYKIDPWNGRFSLVLGRLGEEFWTDDPKVNFTENEVIESWKKSLS